MSITIREKSSGTTLAEAEEGPGLAKYEGNWYFDPAAVRANADVDDWHVRPADGNPGCRSGVWVIEAGDYADEGEPDLHITVETEYAQDVAEFIVQVVKEALR